MDAERAVFWLVPSGAETDFKPPVRNMVDRRCHFCDKRWMPERVTGHKHANPG
jgi:hypothetical protein